MCDEFVQKITAMLEGLSIDSPPEQTLDSLNQLFASFSENLQLMSDEERAAQREQMVEAQRVFHSAGLQIINQLSGQTEAERSGMVVDEQTAATEQNVAIVVSEQNEVAQEQAQLPQNDDEDGAWGGEASASQNQMDVTPSAEGASSSAEQLVRIPYLDFEYLFRPLFEMRSMEQVDEMELNRFIVTLIGIREQAERLAFPLEQEQQFIMALIQNRLDYVSRSLWMWQVDRDEPTLKDLESFLAKRSKRIEAHEQQNRPSTSAGPSAGPSAASRFAPNSGAVPRAQAAPRVVANPPTTSKSKKSKATCVECNGEHFLHKCDRFKSMSMVQKRATLDFNRLCHNCFSAAHTTGQCTQGVCKRCKTKHNSLLCPNVPKGDKEQK